MRNALLWSVALTIVFGGMLVVCARAEPTSVPAGIALRSGWSLLQERQAQASIEQDATDPSGQHTHLLHITCTQTAAPGEGRAGAASSTAIAVQKDQWFDVTFSGWTDGRSVGLVFSLETADGQVLARTTLPEIGRRGRRASTEPAEQNWPHYLVALHARGSDASAHLTITPIEPTSIWLEDLTITPRQ